MFKAVAARCLTVGRGAFLGDCTVLSSRVRSLTTKAPLSCHPMTSSQTTALRTPYRFGSAVNRQPKRWAPTSQAKTQWKKKKKRASTTSTLSKRAKAAQVCAGNTKKTKAKQPIASKPSVGRGSTASRGRSSARVAATPRKKKALSPYERQTIKYNQRMARIEDLYKDYKRSASRGNTW